MGVSPHTCPLGLPWEAAGLPWGRGGILGACGLISEKPGSSEELSKVLLAQVDVRPGGRELDHRDGGGVSTPSAAKGRPQWQMPPSLTHDFPGTPDTVHEDRSRGLIGRLPCLRCPSWLDNYNREKDRVGRALWPKPLWWYVTNAGSRTRRASRSASESGTT
jgi:hypothetical protein